MNRWYKRSNGFSLIELLVVLAVIGLLASLLLPAISVAREAARKATCSSHLRQVGLALFEYETAFKQYVPMRCGALTNADGLWLGSRTSGFVDLCPYLDYKGIYAMYYQGFEASLPPTQTFSKDGEPWWRGGNYTPWRTQVSILRCPSDPGKIQRQDWGSMGRTNFAFCIGDSQMGTELAAWEASSSVTRGMFQQFVNRTSGDCQDGMSNTILLAEICTAAGAPLGDRTPGAPIRGFQATSVPASSQQGITPTVCLATSHNDRYVFDQHVAARRGMHWGDGTVDYVGVNTVLPPNSPSCITERNEGPGIHSAASYHGGGINALMADGSIRFINNSIDTGDLTQASPGVYYNDGALISSPNWYQASPYGVWGALGTRDAKD